MPPLADTAAFSRGRARSSVMVTFGGKSKRTGPAVEQVQGGKKVSILGAFGPHVSPFLAWQDTERFQARSRELEQKLVSKEQELEQLIQKQRRVCLSVNSDSLTLHSIHRSGSCPLSLPST